MATHSITVAWEIPWTEEPCGLQSMGSQESDTTEVTEHMGPEVRQCFTRALLFPRFKLHMNPGTGPWEWGEYRAQPRDPNSCFFHLTTLVFRGLVQLSPNLPGHPLSQGAPCNSELSSTWDWRQGLWRDYS